MRLIGGKDYYDGVTGFDSDDRIVFVRTQFEKAVHRTREQAYSINAPYEFDTEGLGKGWRARQDGANLRVFHVLFCGTVYPGLYWVESTYDTDAGKHHHVNHTFITADAVREELKRQKAKLPDEADSWNAWRPIGRKPKVTDETLEDFLKPWAAPQSVVDQMIADQVVHSINWGEHPQEYKKFRHWYDNTDGLKSIGFPSRVDPWQAYQQIDMWLGSQLAREEDNMVKLSDKEIIAKHGFDKVSFRNTHHVGKPRGQK